MTEQTDTAEHHTVGDTLYLCHKDDHYCPGIGQGAAAEDALADTPTPGCSCGHDGMGAAWHERGVCQWLVGEDGR